MAKNAIREYSTTAAANTDIGGIGVQGSNAVSNFDNAFREVMKQLADMNAGNSPINDTFVLCDPVDPTKRLRLDAGLIATGTTRVIQLPNYDLILGTAAARDTGTAGATVPLLNGANSWSAAQTFIGGATFAAAGDTVLEYGRTDGVASVVALDFHTSATAVDYNVRFTFNGGSGSVGSGNFDIASATFTKSGNTVYHAGNDGAGSGMDTDYFRGQDPAYYTNIPARLGYTPVHQGGGAGQLTNLIYIGWLGSFLGLQVDSSDFGANWPISISGNAVTVGGVALAGLARVTTGTTANDTSFAIGHVIAVTKTAGLARNEAVSPCLYTVNTQFYVDASDAGAGSALAGTWQCRGRTDAAGAVYIAQRVA